LIVSADGGEDWKYRITPPTEGLVVTNTLIGCYSEAGDERRAQPGEAKRILPLAASESYLGERMGT